MGEYDDLFPETETAPTPKIAPREPIPPRPALAGGGPSATAKPDKRSEYDDLFPDDPPVASAGSAPLGALKTLAGSALRLPENLAANAVQAFQGQGGQSVADPDLADKFVGWVRQRNLERRKAVQDEYGDANILPGIPIKVTDVADQAQNFGFSGVTMGAGAAAGAATALGAGALGIGATAASGPAAPAVASAALAGVKTAVTGASMAAAGGVAYRISSADTARAFLEVMDETKRAQGLGPMTVQEEEALKRHFSEKATEVGLWEAVTEGAGAVVGLGLMKTPLTRMLGKNIGTKLIARIGEMYGVELVTEIPTEIGQSRALAGTPLQGDEKPLNWDWEGVKEATARVAPGVILMSTILGGGAHVYHMVKGERQEELTPQRYIDLVKAAKTGEMPPEGLQKLVAVGAAMSDRDPENHVLDAATRYLRRQIEKRVNPDAVQPADIIGDEKQFEGSGAFELQGGPRVAPMRSSPEDLGFKFDIGKQPEQRAAEADIQSALAGPSTVDLGRQQEEIDLLRGGLRDEDAIRQRAIETVESARQRREAETRVDVIDEGVDAMRMLREAETRMLPLSPDQRSEDQPDLRRAALNVPDGSNERGAPPAAPAAPDTSPVNAVAAPQDIRQGASPGAISGTASDLFSPPAGQPLPGGPRLAPSRGASVEPPAEALKRPTMAINLANPRAKTTGAPPAGSPVAGMTGTEPLPQSKPPAAAPALAINSQTGATIPSAQKPLADVIANPKSSLSEVKAEKQKLKAQVIAGVKSGRYPAGGAVRFGTVDEIREALRKGRLPISDEHGVIHAQPIIDRDDDAFSAYGSYDKHNMAIVIPPEYVANKPDAHTKEVLVDENVPLEKLRFLIDGHDKEYTYAELRAELVKAVRQRAAKPEQAKAAENPAKAHGPEKPAEVSVAAPQASHNAAGEPDEMRPVPEADTQANEKETAPAPHHQKLIREAAGTKEARAPEKAPGQQVQAEKTGPATSLNLKIDPAMLDLATDEIASRVLQPLDTIMVSLGDVIEAETGAKRAARQVPAGKALKLLDGRIEKLEALLECVG